MKRSVPPIACTLTPDEQRNQASELLPALAAQAAGGEWTAAGLRLSFPPTVMNLAAIARTVDRERVCCPFLSFRVDIPAEEGPFVLEVSGPPGTRELLATLSLAHPPGRPDGSIRTIPHQPTPASRSAWTTSKMVKPRA